jgi:Phage tail assembly chaperone protein, TAC
VGDSFAIAATRLAGLTGAILGWRPDEFWRATPAELAAIFDALVPPTAAPPTSDDLTRLRERFPDGQ